MKKIFLLSLIIILSIQVMAQKGQWVKLFDGKTTAGWHNWKSSEVKGWSVKDGILVTPGKSGDLVSDKEYGDFELEFEFKVAEKGNSGIIYKVIENPEDKSLFASYASGPEYQIIDDKNYPHTITDKQKTGANYDIYAPSDLNIVKPAGTWNKGKIIIKENTITHILNGKVVVTYTYGDETWTKAVGESKFSKWPYATAHHKGHIVLQDHNDAISFKSIKIKEL
jgi:hypothetical protein